MNIFLTTGTVLYTNYNRPMLKIVADNCGRHDTLGGACATESNTVRYAIEKKFMHACRDSWMLACNENTDSNLEKRDIAHNINFFMNVPSFHAIFYRQASPSSRFPDWDNPNKT